MSIQIFYSSENSQGLSIILFDLESMLKEIYIYGDYNHPTERRCGYGVEDSFPILREFRRVQLGFKRRVRATHLTILLKSDFKYHAQIEMFGHYI